MKELTLLQLHNKSERLWEELDLGLRTRIIAIMDENIAEVKPEILADWKDNPLGWWIPHHFDWGMSIRNLFRQNGLPDSVLPGEQPNWDDYWVTAIEKSVEGISPRD